ARLPGLFPESRAAQGTAEGRLPRHLLQRTGRLQGPDDRRRRRRPRHRQALSLGRGYFRHHLQQGQRTVLRERQPEQQLFHVLPDGSPEEGPRAAHSQGDLRLPRPAGTGRGGAGEAIFSASPDGARGRSRRRQSWSHAEAPKWIELIPPHPELKKENLDEYTLGAQTFRIPRHRLPDAGPPPRFRW